MTTWIPGEVDGVEEAPAGVELTARPVLEGGAVVGVARRRELAVVGHEEDAVFCAYRPIEAAPVARDAVQRKNAPCARVGERSVRIESRDLGSVPAVVRREVDVPT